ncbi:MAG: homoprotocatechuate degradation operon regulator HpaR [Gammaproteobacteria bacterium]|nr:homoprotocatechuate degradation operon regulator HpaR [Gammaproteobacteria bacterium]
MSSGLPGIEDSLPIMLLRTREAVMQRFRPHLANHGVTEQQWRVLRALAEHSTLDAGQLAELCCILPPSLSRILSTLEQQGLIKRLPAETDLRRVVISLKPKGRQLFNKMQPESMRIYASIQEDLGGASIDELLEQLRAVQRVM